MSFVGVGASQGAVAALRAGQIDAISNLDPVMTILARSNDITIISDTRDVAEADKVFGGPMPAATLYAPVAFIDKNPNTVQALTNAIVRADKWIQQAGPSDIVKVGAGELPAGRSRRLHRRLPEGASPRCRPTA